MPQKPRPGLTFVMALAAFLAPVLAATYLAWWESYARERALSLCYAEEILRRMEAASNQVHQGVATLNQAKLPPCSKPELQLLQRVGLGSSYVKAFGRVANDTLLCTSQSGAEHIALGKPDLVTAGGISEYLQRALDPEAKYPLNVFAVGGFAAIVDPKLVVDVSTEGSGIPLVLYVPSASHVASLAGNGGDLPSDWMAPLDPGARVTLLNGGYLLSQVRSAQRDLAGIAAIPETYVYKGIWNFAIIFVPLGLLCGALLVLMVNLLRRVQSSFPNMLRQAINDGNLYVVYQPVVELETRRIIGAEALIRWRSRFAEMRPEYFIPQAEQHGLIQYVTAEMLLQVARDMPHFLKLAPDFCVAVNLSAADLSDPRTVDAMEEVLRISGARPENFELEATERSFLQGPETAGILDALRARGFSVAIDDFGTGYSSLACLQSLSLDTLKIDRAFVDTINTDGATSQVVLHIIQMAHSMHLDMVAEGVETEFQTKYLLERGVRYGQGWHFGRPMEIGLFAEHVRVQNTFVGAFSAEAFA